MNILMTYIKKQYQLVIAVFLALTLTFTPSCYAAGADDLAGSDSTTSIYGGSAVLALISAGIAAFFATAFYYNNKDKDNNVQSTQPQPRLQNVVLGNVQGLVYEDTTLLARSEIIAGLDGGYINSVVVRGGNVYAGTSSGNVWKYTDSSGWTKVGGKAPDGSSVYSVVVDSSGNVYAGANNVWKCAANGSWEKVGNLADGIVWSVAVDSVDNVYVGADNGKVWKCAAGSSVLAQLGGSFSSSVTSVAVDSEDNVYAGTNEGNVWQYTVGGSVWSRLDDNIDGSTVWSVAVDSDGNVYAGTDNGNVWQYSDSAWTKQGSLADGTVWSVAVDSGGNIYAGTDNGGVWQYTGTGDPGWNNLSSTSFSGSVYSVTVDSSDNVYAGNNNYFITAGYGYGYNDNIWKYDGNWTKVGSNIALDGSIVSSVVVDKDSNIYAGTYAGNVWEYVASGSSWIQVGGGLINGDGDGGVFSVAVDKSSNIYAGTYNSNVWKYNGSVWTKIGALADGIVWSVAVDSSGNVYVGTDGIGGSGNVWKYAAGGSSWIQVGGASLDSSNVYSVAVDSGGNVYAGTAQGHVLKYDGSTWIMMSGDVLESTPIYSVAVDSSGNVYAGTSNGNVWKCTVSSKVKLGNLAAVDGSAVYSVAIDSSGNVYAGTYDMGNVWKYSNGVWNNTGYGNGSAVYSLAIMP